MTTRRETLTREAWAAVKGAAWGVMARIQEQAADMDVAAGQMGFLHALSSADGPLTPGELAACLGLVPATVTGALDRLEEQGLIRRDRSEQDRRAVLVTITAKGRATTRRWRATVGATVREMFAPVTEAELAMIADALARVAPPIEGPPRELMSKIRHDAQPPAGGPGPKRTRKPFKE